jgi:hypothetical protein
MNTTTTVKLNDFPPDRYNVLIPVTSMQIMTDMQRIVVNEVRLDTTVDANGVGRDIYKDKTTGKFAVTKVGGMKLAAAANISIVKNESVQPDVCTKCIEMSKAIRQVKSCGDCPHRYDVKYIVTVRVPEPSGGFRLIDKPKEIDCVMQKESMTEAQYKRFLPHRASIAESKALMRCIRDALGLAASYTLDELKKPFIIAHAVPNLDAPEIRERLAGSYLQSMGLLFETSSGARALPESTAPALPAKPEEHYEEPDGAEPYSEADYPTDETDYGPLPWGEGDSAYYCEDCDAELVKTTSRNGERTWTPEDIKAFSERTFGRCLCTRCQSLIQKQGRQ